MSRIPPLCYSCHGTKHHALKFLPISFHWFAIQLCVPVSCYFLISLSIYTLLFLCFVTKAYRAYVYLKVQASNFCSLTLASCLSQSMLLRLSALFSSEHQTQQISSPKNAEQWRTWQGWGDGTHTREAGFLAVVPELHLLPVQCCCCSVSEVGTLAPQCMYTLVPQAFEPRRTFPVGLGHPVQPCSVPATGSPGCAKWILFLWKVVVRYTNEKQVQGIKVSI